MLLCCICLSKKKGNYKQKGKVKIVYCLNSIGKLGGTEKITITKANALARIPGNQVWIIVASGEEPPLLPLENVSVVYLDLHYYEEDWRGYWFAMMDCFKKVKIHKKLAEKVLNEIGPDILISIGSNEKRFLHKLRITSNPALVKEIHMEKRYRTKNAHSWKGKLFAKMAEWYEFSHTSKKYDKIVLTTKADKTGSWENWDKVTIIPNSVSPYLGKMSGCESKTAISAGRLHSLKNFQSLINVWKLVHLKHPDWKLQIWGEGEERKKLQNQIERMGLTNVVQLMGYTPDLRKKMSEASVFVLSSLSEAFSLVTVEAMSVGIPTVAYRCSGGLRYVVKEGNTGFLVPENDEKAFADRVCLLIENDGQRKAMGKAAFEESRKYATENIISQWMSLFDDLLEKKQRIHNFS